jgi:hypothetical protein
LSLSKPAIVEQSNGICSFEMAGLVKLLLIGCALYFCFVFGNALPAGQVTSLVSDAVARNLPSRVSASIYGHGRQMRRFKRDVTTKHLDDPDDCIRHCSNNETSAIVTVTMKNMAKLVAIALEDMTGDELKNPEKEAEFKKKIEERTIANMGPLFDDLCSTSKAADACFRECPSSQLRQITVLEHNSADAFCEPSKNWKNFAEYFNAINCTNATEEENHCDTKCGPLIPLSNVTGLEINEAETTGEDLKYETDSAKNTAAVGTACKTITCQVDCYKPLITERCGAKAYDLYARMAKLEPHSTLGILKLLGAVEKSNDCKNNQ